MRTFRWLCPIPQIGTLSGNPLAAAAGLKTMEILRRAGSYERLRDRGKSIMSALDEHLSAAGVDHQIVGDPVLFDVVFASDRIIGYRGVLGGDASLGKRFNQKLRERETSTPDGKIYPSLALTDDDIAQTVDAIVYAAKHIGEG